MWNISYVFWLVEYYLWCSDWLNLLIVTLCLAESARVIDSLYLSFPGKVYFIKSELNCAVIYWNQSRVVLSGWIFTWAMVCCQIEMIVVGALCCQIEMRALLCCTVTLEWELCCLTRLKWRLCWQIEMRVVWCCQIEIGAVLCCLLDWNENMWCVVRLKWDFVLCY